MRISEDCSLCLKDGVCPLQPVVDGQIGESPRAMFGTAIAFATHVGTVECPHRILTEMQSAEPL
ncbi:MAG: hypothetical protein KBC26_01255 [Candidatus Pacebacteria bacterium]|nr:hypothetical protein [Candidatus Paceibacterota bacterium]